MQAAGGERDGREEEECWRRGVYLENPPQLLSHAAESSQKVADEKGLGRAAAPQDQQAPGQDVCSRELRSNITAVIRATPSQLTHRSHRQNQANQLLPPSQKITPHTR